MKVQLTNPAGQTVTMEIAPEVLSEVSVLLYDGQHYLFDGFAGKFQSTVRFSAIKPPLEIEAVPQPEPAIKPERKFFGQQKERTYDPNP